ncbi:MAG: DNA replication and repair protein RecF [Bdellovibrionales bacterium]|nr:DNA replication and repair protein RecF [Bdellovibrionales bacterium]
MVVRHLKIRNFRNYSHLDLSLRPGVNVLLGENGQGKTNLLEAIFLICRGRSFRPGDTKAWLGPDESSVATIQVVIDRKDQQTDEIKMILGGSRRSFFINGKRSSRGHLMSRYPCVLFSPESLGVIKEGPELRRELLDDLVLSHSPLKSHVVDQYHRALRSRNRWLRDAKLGVVVDRSEANRVLDSMQPGFLSLAVDLTVARLEALQSILPNFKHHAKKAFPESDVDISVDYSISGVKTSEPDPAAIHQMMETRLAQLRNAELDSGTSLVGPHKHDIEFLFAGNNSRFFCSQGQQRALILSFKIAQIMYHYGVHQEYPILLLDDVLSELDQQRRTNLIEALKSIRSQILVTTTDLSFPLDFGNTDIAVLQVARGEIVEAVK